MAWLTNVIIEDKEVESERLELTDKGSVYFLGPNLMLRNCTLVLKVSARNLFFCGVHLVGCTIEVKQELKNSPWVRASLKGCQFKGRLSSCDFGPWRNYTEGWEFGSIEDCDFTKAQLDGCRFHGCDTRTLQFPRWPCFTLLDPLRHASELRRVKWPGIFGDIIIDNLYKNPSSTMALTYHAPSVAKRLETTPEELRAVLEKFDSIVY